VGDRSKNGRGEKIVRRSVTESLVGPRVSTAKDIYIEIFHSYWLADLKICHNKELSQESRPVV
jgi:hypothetical protein